MSIGIDCEEALIGHLDQSLASTEQVEELFWFIGGAERIQTRPLPPCHYYYMICHKHVFGYKDRIFFSICESKKVKNNLDY